MPELLHAPESPAAALLRAPQHDGAEPALEHDGVAHTQHALGNQSLQQTLRGLGIHARLTVSEPGDPVEEEADRVADQVLRMADPPAITDTPIQVQREIAPDLEEDEDEEELPVRPKGEPGASPSLSPGARAQIGAGRAGGVALPSSERSFFEPRLGRDLGGVRVHNDAAAARAARAVSARAFTVGSDVVFAPGQYAPGTSAGRGLLAHELAHVAQQSRASAPAADSGVVARQATTAPAPAAPATPAPAPAPAVTATPASGTATGTAATPPAGTAAAPATGTAMAPAARAESAPVPPGVPAEEFMLQGASTFAPPATIAAYLDERGKTGGVVRARFGNIAAGLIDVKKDGESYATPKGRRYSSIPLVHPALAPLAGTGIQPMLAVRIQDSKIDGFVSIAAVENKAADRDALFKFIEDHPDAMRWIGLSDINLPGTNKLEGGNLTVKTDKFSFKVGGFLRGSGSFGLENEALVFNASAHIKVKKVAEADLQIERDELGGLKGKAELPVRIEKFQGNLTAAFENGFVDIKGRVKYTTKKLTGEVTLLVTDEETARNVAKQKLPPDQIVTSATETAAPAGAPALAKPGPRALAGWGDLDFRFTPWLTGKATVIVDGEGHITVVGEIAPPLRIEIFPQKDFVKPVFKIEARALYGVPVVGNVFLFANVGIDALAKFGPGTLYNMRIEGTYSTDPAVLDRFSISATLNISAYAGLRLKGEGGVGIEILDHDIKAGAALWALAGIKGYVEATPTIGYRELAEPVAGEEGQFYIQGHMELAAQPFLGLGGELFVELDSPWWSPAPDKRWPWPLGELEYPLPGAFGIGADVDYVIGSTELPEIEFTAVDFNAEKFMTDVLHDKVTPESTPAEQDKPGDWKEGEGAAGTVDTAADPNAKDTQGAPAEGDAPKDPENAGEVPDPEKAEAWATGLAALGELAEESETDALTDEEIDEELASIKDEYGFTSLEAVDVGEDWGIEAAMNPTKPAKKPPHPKKQRKSKYGAKLIGKNEFEGHFSDYDDWFDGHDKFKVEPHPANEYFGHPNDETLPEPTEDYYHVKPGVQTGGAPRRSEWTDMIEARYRENKDFLLGEKWPKAEADVEARNMVGYEYSQWGLPYQDVRLARWEGHHIHPVNWGGDRDELSNIQYIREGVHDRVHYDFWDERKREILEELQG